VASRRRRIIVNRSPVSANLRTSRTWVFVVSPQGRFLHGALIDADGGATKTI
jgi:hypothetical protein